MEMSPKDGGPGAEYIDRVFHGSQVETMNLRDWFAGQAREKDVNTWRDILLQNGMPVTREEAKYAYADAMLRAREEGR